MSREKQKYERVRKEIMKGSRSELGGHGGFGRVER